MKCFKVLLFSCILFHSNFVLRAQENYPVPAKTKNLLFYFQRSHNKNTIIYVLNTLPDGKLNFDKPVLIYWIRYEEGGVKKELTYIQRKAFGLHWKLTDKTKGNFIIHFNSFKKRDIFLMNNGSNYKAYTTINSEMAELNRFYIKSKNNSIGVPMSVDYVEISGINLKNGKIVIERYIP